MLVNIMPCFEDIHLAGRVDDSVIECNRPCITDDYNRVVLSTTKDDYINASYLKSTAPNEPNCILTQAPIGSTLEDFWAMVWEQSAETLLSLSSFQEVGSSEIPAIHDHIGVAPQSHR